MTDRLLWQRLVELAQAHHKTTDEMADMVLSETLLPVYERMNKSDETARKRAIAKGNTKQ